MKRLRGKSAVITGGGSGIGRASAIRFAAEGASVAILDRDGESASTTARQLQSSGSEAQAIEVDLGNGAAAEEAIYRAGKSFDGLDILVNNAATFVAQDFLTLSVESWRRILDVNLTAYFLCGRAAALEMQKRGGGSIVNVASVHSRVSEPLSGAYAASKSAVAQLTRNMAIEFAPFNIVVNSISPGFIRTAMSIIDGVDETTTDRFKSYYIQSGRIPMGRAGQPEDIAAAALFFCSRECGYVTGVDLIVDGGLTITL
jgi:NAD(P)-dependent dehydrogenase (short-subunit alcohol dehydrogenase family)